MSADNWFHCPKCAKTRDAEAARMKEFLALRYGIISAKEYTREAAEAERNANKELPLSLREDYGIGIDVNGRFFVTYLAKCQNCDFEFDYKYEQKVPIAGPGDE